MRILYEALYEMLHGIFRFNIHIEIVGHNVLEMWVKCCCDADSELEFIIIVSRYFGCWYTEIALEVIHSWAALKD